MTSDLLTAFDRHVREKDSVLPSAYRTEHRTGVTRVIGPFPTEGHNWIEHHQLDLADAEAIIDEQIAAFGALGHSFRWKLYDHDTPAELSALLLARGFKVFWDRCSLMVIESSACGEPRMEGIDFVRLEDPEALATEMRAIAESVWDKGASDLIQSLVMELREKGDHVSLYVAKEHGETVSFGMVRYDSDFRFGGLFAGATVPTARHRGIYRAMVGVRARDAVARGARHVYTEAGPMSRPILERIGFSEISRVANYAYRVR